MCISITVPREHMPQPQRRTHIMCDTKNIGTCLSNAVQNMMCKALVTDDTCNILTPDLTIEWNKIGLGNRNTTTSEEYLAELTKLSPAINYIRQQYLHCSMEQVEAWPPEHLMWTHRKHLFSSCFEHMQLQASSCTTSLVILLVTAALENSLGNVLHMKRKQVPFLLKDILAMEELSTIFGANVMLFLQILIGPPTSANLRNVLWHGFVRPEEVDDRFAYLLLCVCRTLGKKLAERGIAVEDIPKRRLVNLVQASSKLKTFESVEFDAHAFLELVKCCALVLPGRTEYFKECVSLYRNSSYAESLVLLLPQVECVLRVLFVWENQCPNRLLTAETSVFYTTLDEILAEFIEPHKKNRLVDVLGGPVFELFLDLFTYPSGPRIRDRVGHGEVELASIDAQLVKHVLCAVASVCAMFHSKLCHLTNEDFVQEILKASNSYRSLYHPISLLKEKVYATHLHIMSWKEFPQPDHKPTSHEHMNEDDSLSDSVAALVLDTFNIAGLVAEGSWRDAPISVVNSLQCSTLFRPRSELECVTVLSQITEAAFQTSQQVCEALTYKYNMWKSHELRSRQRSNYDRLLQSVSSLRNVLSLVICVVCGCLKNINYVPLLDRNRLDALLRFLKMALKCGENMRTLTSQTRNRWEESQRLCVDFMHYTTDALKSVTFDK